MIVDRNSPFPNSMAVPSTANFVIKIKSKIQFIKSTE